MTPGGTTAQPGTTTRPGAVVRVPAGLDGPGAADLVRRVRRALRHGDVEVDTSALDDDTPAGVRAAVEGLAGTARSLRATRPR